MNEEILLAQLNAPSVDYSGVKAFKPTQVIVSEPSRTEQAADDPTNYLLAIGLIASALAVFFFSRVKQAQPAPSRTTIAALGGLGAASLALMALWPSFFGQPLPLSIVGEMGPRVLEELVVPAVLKALFAGLVVGGLVYALLPGDAKSHVPQPIKEVTMQRGLTTEVGERIKVYKGYEILKAETGVTVNGQPYGGIIAAEKAITEMVENAQ
ncbi:hypothetical protein [Planktotalea sp.]|uniref:hypothetical protein n=1 Tax=Planktotalea sp. TaxID=2029877 RepID=UPI003D6AE24B